MKKQFLTLVAVVAPFIYSVAQDFKVSVTKEDEPKEKITILSGEDMDDYEVSVYLHTTKEKMESVNTYNIENQYFINGKETTLEIWGSIRKASEVTDGAALKFNVDMADIAEERPDLMKEKGNVFKVVFTDEFSKEIAQAEVKFDIPGFSNYESKFCGELFTIKADDDAAKMTKSIFQIVYPDAEILEVLMDDQWNISKTHGGSNTYMIIFKRNGQLKYIKYSAFYKVENGTLEQKPRVRIYNGFIDGWNLAPSCYESLKAVLK